MSLCESAPLGVEVAVIAQNDDLIENAIQLQLRVIVFDDSAEHEAWNLSKELRVVMIGAMLEGRQSVWHVPQHVHVNAPIAPPV